MSEPDADRDAGSEPGPAPARLTVHRTAAWDEQSRQILCSVDGRHVGQLLFGQTLTRDIPAGSHTIKANNTLVWKTVPFEVKPGEQVHFEAINRAGKLTYPMLVIFGAGPLYLTVRRV